jgi:hypothetical protein
VTLSTTVIEGLNVFEVLTADRVVAQVSTEHLYENGHVPSVTFLGTKFEGLKISGIPVTVKYNFGVCGDRPKDPESYLTKRDLLSNTQDRIRKIVKSGYLSGRSRTQYDERLAQLDQLIDQQEGNRFTCSVVESIDISDVRKQIPGVETVGHVIIIRDFGAVSLGEVEVGIEQPRPSRSGRPMTSNGEPRMSQYFELTMLNMELGCVGDASAKTATSRSNGTTNP